MVGKSCCSCQYRTELDKVNGSAGFFFLPKNHKKREAWVNGLGLDPGYFLDVRISRQFYVCFRHFKIQDMNTSGKCLKIKKGIFSP